MLQALPVSVVAPCVADDICSMSRNLVGKKSDSGTIPDNRMFGETMITHEDPKSMLAVTALPAPQPAAPAPTPRAHIPPEPPDTQKVSAPAEDLDRWVEFVSNKVKGAVPSAFREIVDRAREFLTGMGEEPVQYVRVENLKQQQLLGRPVRLRGAYKGHEGVKVAPRRQPESDIIEMMARAEDAYADGRDPRDDYQRVTVFHFGEADGERHVFSTVPTSDDDVLDRFQRSGNAVVYEIDGILIPCPWSEEFMLLLTALRTIECPLDLVEPTQDELDKAERWIASHKGKSLLAPMRNIVAEGLDILNLDDPTQREALEARILSAASEGRINGENARIHIAEIGPPGIGKGKRNRAAQAIQPVSKVVEAQAVTEDGLYGNTGTSGKKRVVRAGLVPQAHQGLFVVEDIHQANSLKNRRFVIALGQTMETGRCEAANASRTSHEALVAFHVDSNRASDVDARRRQKDVVGIEKVTIDTGLPINLLTRFDYIREWPGDMLKQVRLAMDIARQPATVGAPPVKETDRGVRMVQVTLALLRTQIPTVEIGREVAEYLQTQFQAVVNVPQSVMESHPHFGDFLTRGPKSFRKFVAAHARLRNSAIATREDVDAALPFVFRKMETVLFWLAGESEGGTQPTRKVARQLLIAFKFSGHRVSVSDVASLFPHVSKKTVERDLAAIAGEKGADGRWTVPDARVGETAA